MSDAVSLRRDRPRRAPAPPSDGVWRRVRSLVAVGILLAVSGFALLTVVLPLALGAQTYTVLTGSMQPGMPPGTMIAVRPVAIEDVRVGDVVTYQIHSGEPAVVTHRVVGTTSSTGGARLLLTRGDANDVDDPPVQSEQLRGTVVLAVPYLGLPAALFGGEERGAVIAMIGALVVGYGVVLLAVEVRRARTRSRASLVVVAVLAAAVSAASGAPEAARAAGDGTEPTPPGALQVSLDGTVFAADGAVSLFDAVGPLAPGATVASSLWIRNASPDPARAGVRLRAAPAAADPADRALADAVRLVVDSATVPPGGEWVSGVIPAGETVRLDVGLRMDAAAGNDTRRATAVVTPVIRLTDARPDGGEEASARLPSTGLRSTPWAPVLVVVAVLLTVGVAFRVRGIRDR